MKVGEDRGLPTCEVGPDGGHGKRFFFAKSDEMSAVGGVVTTITRLFTFHVSCFDS